MDFHIVRRKQIGFEFIRLLYTKIGKNRKAILILQWMVKHWIESNLLENFEI